MKEVWQILNKSEILASVRPAKGANSVEFEQGGKKAKYVIILIGEVEGERGKEGGGGGRGGGGGGRREGVRGRGRNRKSRG